MGPSTLIADVVLWPDRSIIRQSYDARERAGLGNSSSSSAAAAAAANGGAGGTSGDAALAACHLAYGNLNGDGFGIGWYSSPGDACASSSSAGAGSYYNNNSNSSSSAGGAGGGGGAGSKGGAKGGAGNSAGAAAAAASLGGGGVGGGGGTGAAAALTNTNHRRHHCYGAAASNTNASRADPTPCVFTSVTPAWNNENLGRLARKIASPLVFAHVRAAMPGMAVNEQNCHPFAHGRYLWVRRDVFFS